MNNKNTSSQIETILVDVRKAYRLLYTYQRRVMDIIQFIGDLTSRRYQGGWSKFSNSSPKDGKGGVDLSFWAWDYLNMYCYEFHFADLVIGQNSVGLSVWLVSDSGFYDSEIGDQPNIESFSSVENSATKLLFVIGKNTWHTKFEDFKMNLKKQSPDYVRKNDEGILLAKSFNLSLFSNGDETRLRLQEIVSFCHLNGITEMTILN